MPGTENRPGHPPTPISFWNVESGPRIPNTPPSPTTLSALQSDVSCRASGSDYPPGRGLRWAQPVQSPQALGGWSLSSEGAQLLLALISCGDFLTALRPLDASGCGNCAGSGWTEGPHPQLEPHPLKPSGDPVYRTLAVRGHESWGRVGEGGIHHLLRGPLTVFITLRDPLPSLTLSFPICFSKNSACFTGSL